MAGTLNQAFDNVVAGSSTTVVVAATLTGSAASAVACFATNDASNASTIAVSDPTNGTYTVLDTTLDTTDQQQTVSFVKTTSAASGSVSVTATWSVANAFKALSVCDCIGVAGGLDQHTAAYQHAPTTTANAQTSGATATLSTQPALVIGFGFNANGTGGQPALGTGFSAPTTGVSNWWSFGGPTTLSVEYKRVTATTGVAATFTAASNVDSITAVIVIDEVGSTLPSEPWLAPSYSAPSPSPPAPVGGGRTFGPIAPLTTPTRAWAPTLSTTYAPPPPPAINVAVRSLQPIAGQAVAPLSWAPEATPGDAPLPLLSPAVRAIRPILPPAATAVVPLSWAPEFTLPDPPAPPARFMAVGVGPVLPIPGAAVVPALAWRGVTAPVPIFVEPPRPARRFGAFAVTPPPALSWAPEFTVPDPQPPAPVIGQAVRNILPIANALTPLTWQREITAPADPAPPPISSRAVGPISPLVAPPLAWEGWQPPPPIAPVPQVGGGIWAPVAPLVAPPLSWLTWPAITAPPAPQPTGGGTAGPVAPLATPALAWLGLRAGPGVAPPIGAPSSEVGPFPAPFPIPTLSWAPHVTPPAIPVPPAAFDAQARSMIPIASQVLVPLSWSPEFTAPIPPAPGVPQSLVFGPISPLVAPVLVWAPSWRAPAAPGPVPTAPASFVPVLPPPAPPALSWAPVRGVDGLVLGLGLAPLSIQAAPILPPAAVPALSWAAARAPDTATIALALRSALVAPVLPPVVAPALSWAPTLALSASIPLALAPRIQGFPLQPPAAAPFAWYLPPAPVVLAPTPLALGGGVLPPVQPGVPALAWLSPAAAAATPELVIRGPAGFGPVLTPALPNTTWLLPSQATPTTVTILTRSSMVEPVTVPAPNVPPQLQPQGYVSAPLTAAWNIPQLQIFGTIFTPPPPPPPVPLPEPSTMGLEEADGTPVDLTGKTVVARYQPIDRSHQAMVSSAVIVNARGGVVTKTWTATDIRGVPTGIMLLQFIVLDGIGRQRTYPIGTYFRVPIVGRPR